MSQSTCQITETKYNEQKVNNLTIVEENEDESTDTHCCNYIIKLWLILSVSALLMIFSVFYSDTEIIAKIQDISLMSRSGEEHVYNSNDSTMQSHDESQRKSAIQICPTLTLFPSDNITSIFSAIQDIQFSMYFDIVNASTNTKKNEAFITGFSPHFYDGNFSTNKTCPYLKFRYNCYANINKIQHFDRWTLQIPSNKLQAKTLDIINVLQEKLNYYQSNVYTKHFLSNLQKYHSPFNKPLKLFFYGNSWMRQIVESLLCLIHSSNNKIIQLYEPTIAKCRHNESVYFDQQNTFCPGYDLEGTKWANQQKHGLNEDDAVIDSFWETNLMQNNICKCHDDILKVKLMDGTQIFYHFSGHEVNKSMKTEILDLKLKEEETEFDFIIFNTGNPPHYEINKQLDVDLQFLDHVNKPIIYVEGQKDISRNMRQLLKQFKFLIAFSEIQRMKKNIKISHMISGDHYCMPGPVSHHILDIIHLINVISTVRC